jgi:hypothetical protein
MFLIGLKVKKIVYLLLLTLPLFFGCTIELQSPIKIKRTKEEEKPPSPQKIALPPSPAPEKPISAERKSETQIVPLSEEFTFTGEKGIEGPKKKLEISKESLPLKHQADTFSPQDIVIISSEYLANTSYEILGRITVKDVSQNGFSKNEAKKALKYEAFRKFGPRAKGITNVIYQGEKSFFGSERYYEASGDVITWEEKITTARSEEEKYFPEHEEQEENLAIKSEDKSPHLRSKPERYPEYKLTESSREDFTPASIIIISNQDLIDYNFQVLGKVTIHSESKDGFSLEQANNALRVEAFKHYGSKARGIINPTYKKKKRWLLMSSKKISEASGEVVTW